MNVMRENHNNMRAWLCTSHAQHAPGFLCRTRKETLFPDIFESGKLRIYETSFTDDVNQIVKT